LHYRHEVVRAGVSERDERIYHFGVIPEGFHRSWAYNVEQLQLVPDKLAIDFLHEHRVSGE
jgi:hypothetical protein